MLAPASGQGRALFRAARCSAAELIAAGRCGSQECGWVLKKEPVHLWPAALPVAGGTTAARSHSESPDCQLCNLSKWVLTALLSSLPARGAGDRVVGARDGAVVA